MSREERSALLGPEEAKRSASSDRLKLAQRALADTEELGMGIMGDLRSQREMLARSKQRLNDADVDITRGSRVLRSMALRARANKLITAGVAAAVFLGLVLVLFWQ
ncbi:hypothetical protein T492DRAFT_1031000 [Pavlovales sp. CCMP2436]|nr:hypothetical protein T492DRAFT_1031000 [Pavlovales sp. CCMP2436]